MKNSISNTLGLAYWKRHRLIYRSAKKHTIALCGSTAAAVCRDNKEYVPSDIDFVCGSETHAMAFIAELCGVLNRGSSHYRLYFNSRNKFCPSGTVLHIRFTSAVWLPVCLFVLPEEKFRYFRGYAGQPIQLLGDVQKAAAELVEIDGKERIAAEPDFHELEAMAEQYAPEEGCSDDRNPGHYSPNK